MSKTGLHVRDDSKTRAVKVLRDLGLTSQEIHQCDDMRINNIVSYGKTILEKGWSARDLLTWHFQVQRIHAFGSVDYCAPDSEDYFVLVCPYRSCAGQIPPESDH